MASLLKNNTNTINDLLTTINNLPNAITIDTTLTQSGQAADAKAVGDALAKHAHQHQSPNVIMWDGDETGHTAIADSEGTLYVHVSDVVPTEDEIYDNESALGMSVNSERIIHTQIYPDIIEVTSDGLIAILFVAIVPSDNFIDTTYGVTFPKKGIYFTKSSNNSIYVSYFYLSNVTLTTPSDPLNAAMIGAAPASHIHSAEDINGGIFGGPVYANKSYQYIDIPSLRNSRLVLSEMTPTVNGEIYWTYE